MNDSSSPPAKPQAGSGLRDDTVLDWARQAGAADLLVGDLNLYLLRRRRRRLAFGSVACAALLVASVSWVAFRTDGSTTPRSTAIAGASATVLRPEQQTLPDGSIIDLNAGAEIDVRFSDSQRRVVLRRGEAHFQVAKDAQRPFVVAAGAIEVRAVGTAFAVDLGTSAVDVVVTEGRIAVNQGVTADATTVEEQPATAAAPLIAALSAGAHIVIEREASAVGHAAPRISELSAADMQARLGWRVPRLKFAATPLAEAVAMFNEYAAPGRDARLVLAPSIPSDVRVSGLLRADDVDSLLRLLAGEFGISAERRAGEIVLGRKSERDSLVPAR